MGQVLAVCISEMKGTQKRNVGSAVFVEDWGREGDAHAGKWHRQVSLLSSEKIDAFRAKGAEVEDGLLVRIWLWRGLILRSFRLVPDFAVARLCWS